MWNIYFPSFYSSIPSATITEPMKTSLTHVLHFSYVHPQSFLNNYWNSAILASNRNACTMILRIHTTKSDARFIERIPSRTSKTPRRSAEGVRITPGRVQLRTGLGGGRGPWTISPRVFYLVKVVAQFQEFHPLRAGVLHVRMSGAWLHARSPGELYARGLYGKVPGIGVYTRRDAGSMKTSRTPYKRESRARSALSDSICCFTHFVLPYLWASLFFFVRSAPLSGVNFQRYSLPTENHSFFMQSCDAELLKFRNLISR